MTVVIAGARKNLTTYLISVTKAEIRKNTAVNFSGNLLHTRHYSAVIVYIQKRIILGTIARTWELVLHRQTPDFEALAKLLDVRYNNSKDDVEHEDIFAGV